MEEDIKRRKVREILARLRAQGARSEEEGDVNDMFPSPEDMNLEQGEEVDPKEQQLMALLRGKKPRN